VLRQLATIYLGELNRHQNQCCPQQDNAYPTQIRNPEKRRSRATPRVQAAKAYTQQQCRDGKAANPKHPCDTVPNVMSDIKDGSHSLAKARNDQKPQTDFPGFGFHL
jgi:hypothetical protein